MKHEIRKNVSKQINYPTKNTSISPLSPFLQKNCKGMQKRNGYKVLNVSAL